MLVAGGTLAVLGCSSSVNDSTQGQIQGHPDGAVVPCGNANPDPCICDRPRTDPGAAIACDRKVACESVHGTWTYGTQGGACRVTDAGLRDAAPTSDVFTIPCGNANPDPCICDRPKTDPAAARDCESKKACEAKGGLWDSIGPPCVRPDGGIISLPLDGG